ncbi:MAG TPA: hypothetical protein VK612_11340 [Pyrinomonadaceae bacterium]|nr:hypothetical protein [Pyrinomonadaceae bacterium]
MREKNEYMRSFAFLLLLCNAVSVFSQAEKEAGSVADDLFAAMKEKSAEKIRSLFTPEGQLVAIDKPRTGDGVSKTRVFTADLFAKNIAGAKGGDFIEKMPSKDVRIDGDLAMVSGRYTFYVGDKFSHCGMNTFHLVKTEAGWKIANAASTLEFQCDRDLKAVDVPVIEPAVADVSSIDGIIKAFYETISGPVGQPRQWGRDRTLYSQGIQFFAIDRDGAKVNVRKMTHTQYVHSTDGSFVKGGFTETEIGRVTRRFGNLAHVFSSYQWQTADKRSSGRGVNSIELLFDGKRWWITAVTWDDETPDNKIPKEFLNGV